MRGYDAWRTASPPEARTHTHIDEYHVSECCGGDVVTTEALGRYGDEVDSNDVCGTCGRRLTRWQVVVEKGE